MTIHYKILAPKHRNIPRLARSAEELDRILRQYAALRGVVGALRIRPVVVEEPDRA